MPNVNRQTIYQMGNVVNDVVKQATGRDIVKQINMDWVTVEQQTIYGEASKTGNVVSFFSPAVLNLVALSADIVPEQSFNGYSHPWAGGEGNNKFSTAFLYRANYGLADDGTMSSSNNYDVYRMVLTPGQYIWSGYSDADLSNQTFRAITYDENGVLIELFKSVWNKGAASQIFTVTEEASYIQFSIRKSYTAVQVEEGTEVHAFSPYENICPISGYSGCDISLSGGETPAITYTVDWETDAGTVFGGFIDVLSGVLTVTHGVIASYDGEELSSTWISDRDVYAEGTTPTTGAQVVYKLAEPVIYELFPETINTREGENIISADTGPVTVTYYTRIDLL